MKIFKRIFQPTTLTMMVNQYNSTREKIAKFIHGGDSQTMTSKNSNYAELSIFCAVLTAHSFNKYSKNDADMAAYLTIVIKGLCKTVLLDSSQARCINFSEEVAMPSFNAYYNLLDDEMPQMLSQSESLDYSMPIANVFLESCFKQQEKPSNQEVLLAERLIYDCYESNCREWQLAS